MKNMTEQLAWQALNQHYQTIATAHMRDWFTTEPDRFAHYSLEHDGILLDYSRNRINDTTLGLLADLARQMQLESKIKALYAGDSVNTTEQRPALHLAERNHELAPSHQADIKHARQRLYHFVDDIHAGKRTGITGKPFKHVVNIGIGGSYLGPEVCVQALKDFATSPLQFHFISSIDPDHLRDVLHAIDPETTLFIVSSKSFTTIETLTNAGTICAWLNSQLGPDAFTRQAVAVTACPDKACHFGLSEEHIFTFKEGIGGRYSIWSTIGMPLVLMIGTKQFSEFLHGAKSMDQHFEQAPLLENMPVLLALLSIWYSNFFHAQAHAIIPYSYRLRSLVPYLQQLEMESNGKSVALNGENVSYTTGAIVFGEEGCNGQHSFYQLLHQGRQLIPVDFILIMKPHPGTNTNHHDVVIASALSQAYSLMHGKTKEEAHHEISMLGRTSAATAKLAAHLAIEGNKPNNLIVLDQLTPARLGSLLALYEHKIFTQSVIWNINPFDQWGVELGKKNLPDILKQLHTASENHVTDAATLKLINHYKRFKDQS